MKNIFFKKLKISGIGRSFLDYKFLRGNRYLYVTIGLHPNNIFYSVSRVNRNLLINGKPKTKILLSKSSESYREKVTKKALKSKALPLLLKFLKDIKSILMRSKEFLVFTIISPIKLRRKLLMSLEKYLLRRIRRTRPVIIEVKDKKNFNGCTPCKQRRKKRKGFRILR